MLSVANLADHLGMTSLCQFAADAIVRCPWTNGLSDLAAVHLLSPYADNNTAWYNLLHHVNRGAYTELQLLEFLENYHVCEEEIASVLQLDQMQPAEIQMLLSILSRSDPPWTCPWHQGPFLVQCMTSGSRTGKGQLIHSSTCPNPGSLLQKAVRQSLQPAPAPQLCPFTNCYTHIFNNIMLSADGKDQDLPFLCPDLGKLCLSIQSGVDEKGTYHTTCKTYAGVSISKAINLRTMTLRGWGGMLHCVP